MVIGLAVIAAIYLLGIAGVRTVDRRPFVQLARSYVHTLVPMAAAYVIAHYFSLLAYNGQAIAYLASDPLGKGWDLFGTAERRSTTASSPRPRSGTCRWACWSPGTSAAWSWRTTARWPLREPRAATTSQYWMLAVMVGFTTVGLWLLSQANQ